MSTSSVEIYRSHKNLKKKKFKRFDPVDTGEMELNKKNVKNYYYSVNNYAKSFLSRIVKNDNKEVLSFMTRKKENVLVKPSSKVKGILDALDLSMPCFLGSMLSFFVMQLVILGIIDYGSLNVKLEFKDYVNNLFSMLPMVLGGSLLVALASVYKQILMVYKTGYEYNVVEKINTKGAEVAAFTSEGVYFSKYDLKIDDLKCEYFPFTSVKNINHYVTRSGEQKMEGLGYDNKVLFTMTNYDVEDVSFIEDIQELVERNHPHIPLGNYI